MRVKNIIQFAFAFVFALAACAWWAWHLGGIPVFLSWVWKNLFIAVASLAACLAMALILGSALAFVLELLKKMWRMLWAWFLKKIEIKLRPALKRDFERALAKAIGSSGSTVSKAVSVMTDQVIGHWSRTMNDRVREIAGDCVNKSMKGCPECARHVVGVQ